MVHGPSWGVECCLAPPTASEEGGEGREGPGTSQIQTLQISLLLSLLVSEYHRRWLPTTLELDIGVDTGVDWIQWQKSDELTQLTVMPKEVSKGPTTDYSACSRTELSTGQTEAEVSDAAAAGDGKRK